MTAKTKQVLSMLGDIKPSTPAVVDHAPPTPTPKPPPLFNVTFPRKVALFVPIKPPEYVNRIARIVLDHVDAERGEWFLLHEMVVVTENLIATGADPAVVHREVRKLEGSIRAQLWHIVMNPEAQR